MTGATVLDHTNGFASCGALLYPPYPSAHDGRGSQDTTFRTRLGATCGVGFDNTDGFDSRSAVASLVMPLSPCLA